MTANRCTLGPRPELNLRFNEPLGLCLDQAPHIEASLFIGRASEIEHMRQVLNPLGNSTEQYRLVLGGLGGVGKTQLAIAYAKKEKDNYDSILWADATSEATLKSSFESILAQLLDIRDIEDLSSQQVVTGVRQWLSAKNNTQWLLIFDNYDEPTSYDLKLYYPQASHGTVIITTRLPSQVEGSRLDIRALDDIEHSLQILQTRSKRNNVSSGKLESFNQNCISLTFYNRQPCSTFSGQTRRSSVGFGYSWSISSTKHVDI